MTLPRSDHFNGKTFFQSHHEGSGRNRDLLRWRLTSRSTPWPAQVARPAPRPAPAPKGDELVLTWIGHASFLLQTARLNVLIDPVFSERASPFSWIGPKRAQPAYPALEDLPPIDAVLLSHDHYDHFDLPSLRTLAAKFAPAFVAPLRHSDLLAQAGAKRIHELDWWQSYAFEGASGAACQLTPSKHWSNRFGTPRNHRLWGGYYLTLGEKRVWFVGDSGYDATMVQSVRDRCGVPDLALVPIGAYEPRWFMAPMHMNPAEAVRTHRGIGAKRSLGMHWGTFQLTDEGRDEPVRALAEARVAAGLAPQEFTIVQPGESVVV